MKAVVMHAFGDADVLRLGEIDPPVPDAGQVLIEVAATSVNRPDVVQRQGLYPPPPGESQVLGLECAGTIRELGPGVAGLAPGDRVFALIGGGGYAELAVADARHVLPIPGHMSFDHAACIAEAYITAFLNLFRNADLADGESVLLHGGGGGVGTAAIQLVRSLCPRSTIYATSSKTKVGRVMELGATRVIDYRDEDFAVAVGSSTAGRGVDVILDHIGANYLERNLQSLAVGGRLVVIGIMQGDEGRLSLGRLMIKRQRIIGSVLRPRSADEKAAIIADFAETVMPLFEQRQIGPVIHARYPLDRVVDAHRCMEASEHFGKIVLIVTETQ